MKNLLYILISLVSSSIFATDQTTLFATANQWYQQGKYQEAITILTKIEKENKSQTSAQLYFNLANCYYQTHQVAPAIYNYEKALLLQPNFQPAITNLQYAQKLRLDDIKEIPKVGLGKLLYDFTTILHYNTWAWLAVALSTLLILCFAVYYFSQKVIIKRLFFISMMAQVVLIILFVFFGFFQKNKYNKDQPAIVFAKQTPVLLAPNGKPTDKKIIHEGTKVYVLSQQKNYANIQFTDQTTGWIETNTIQFLKK